MNYASNTQSTTITESNRMRTTLLAAALALVAPLAVGIAQAGHHAKADHHAGATAKPAQDIVDAAAANADFSTLVAAVKAADLVETLKRPGPYTVFAPTNAAFGALPAGTVDTLLKPENKSKLSGVLTYHVIAGNFDSKRILAQIEAGKGKATLTTVQGAKLTARVADGGVVLTDAKGNKVRVTATDLKQSNGVIHVVENVLMP
jgi:uncharacterized surface protein with fasciclin (FAS1) repeats